jgi:superfamily I DNA/RNA helicase
MRESFRSTTPITELAVNVLSRLSESSKRQDQRELLQLGLLEKIDRNGEEWLQVRYNQIDGPKPIYHRFENRSQEMASIASHLKHLILNDGISPTDICIIYNGRVQDVLQTQLAPALDEIGVELSFQRNRSFERQPNTLVATTAQSFKGYESEVVVIPCVDNYVASEGRILENSLYVAMTRARSLLAIYGLNRGSEASRKIGETISTCCSIQNTRPIVQDMDIE